jgi:hypothetical protein
VLHHSSHNSKAVADIFEQVFDEHYFHKGRWFGGDGKSILLAFGRHRMPDQIRNTSHYEWFQQFASFLAPRLAYPPPPLPFTISELETCVFNIVEKIDADEQDKKERLPAAPLNLGGLTSSAPAPVPSPAPSQRVGSLSLAHSAQQSDPALSNGSGMLRRSARVACTGASNPKVTKSRASEQAASGQSSTKRKRADQPIREPDDSDEGSEGAGAGRDKGKRGKRDNEQGKDADEGNGKSRGRGKTNNRGRGKGGVAEEVAEEVAVKVGVMPPKHPYRLSSWCRYVLERGGEINVDVCNHLHPLVPEVIVRKIKFVVSRGCSDFESCGLGLGLLHVATVPLRKR